jgi:hypothetical protein
MSDTDDSTDTASARAARAWRAAQAAGGRPDVPPREPGNASDGQFTSAVRAAIVLAMAAGRLLRALGKLASAEWQVLRLGIPLLVVAVAALGLFAISLWACLMALVVWLLLVATGSLGLALGLLVVIQACLAVFVAIVIKLWIRQLLLPSARAELRQLGRTLLRDAKRASGRASASGRTRAGSDGGATK